MAQIQLIFRNDAGAVIVQSNWSLSGTNASRILAAEQTNLGVNTNQLAADVMLDRAVKEWIGDTKTVERNKTAISDIPKE